MDRRTFLAGTGVVLLAAPLAAEAFSVIVMVMALSREARSSAGRFN